MRFGESTSFFDWPIFKKFYSGEGDPPPEGHISGQIALKIFLRFGGSTSFFHFLFFNKFYSGRGDPLKGHIFGKFPWKIFCDLKGLHHFFFGHFSKNFFSWEGEPPGFSRTLGFLGKTRGKWFFFLKMKKNFRGILGKKTLG